MEHEDDAAPWVAARAEEVADYIKIVIEDCCDHVPIDPVIVPALVDAAHAQGLLVIAHLSRAAHARVAVDAGVDALAHGIKGPWPDEPLVDRLAEAGTFVVATLSVSAEPEWLPGILSDTAITDWLIDAQAQELQDPLGTAWADVDATRGGIISTAALHAAGVPVLAGADAGNPGVLHGASMHGELALLHQAGLSPGEALTAATAAPADAFGLDDRGRITEGRRADLVLVDGDPSADLAAAARIRRIWKAGRAVDREDLAHPLR